MNTNQNPSPATVAHLKAGWRVSEWITSAGIGRSTLYALPPELAPESVRIGSMRIITEAPGAWLQRVSAAQRAAA